MSKKESAARDSRQQKTNRTLRKIGIIAVVLLLFLALGYGANNRIEITKYTYETSEIPYAFDGFRIVQLSDLHNKIFPEDNESLLREVRSLNPDLIVLTGDFIDGFTHTNVDAALLFMKQIPDIAPTYYIYGNHEHRLSQTVLDSFQRQIADYGVHFLYNESVQIEAATGQTFTLIGLDDLSLQANILNTLAEDAPDDFQVLLAHEPQFLEDYYAESGVDLVFAGHAHGGQWRIPFTHQGLYAPDQGLLPKLTEGVFTAANTTMYVSRGLGNSAFPLRLNNHPEIVCVTLHVVSDEAQS